jgi:hypothetical protein
MSQAPEVNVQVLMPLLASDCGRWSSESGLVNNLLFLCAFGFDTGH